MVVKMETEYYGWLSRTMVFIEAEYIELRLKYYIRKRPIQMSLPKWIKH